MLSFKNLCSYFTYRDLLVLLDLLEPLDRLDLLDGKEQRDLVETKVCRAHQDLKANVDQLVKMANVVQM